MRKLLDGYFPTVVGDDGRPSLRLTLHHALYFLLLFVLVGAQPVSNFMMSGMEILLFANWVFEWDMRRKFAARRRGTMALLLAFAVLMVVHLLWMLPTENLAYGWKDLFAKLPLLAIPLVLLTSRPLNRKQLEWLFFTLVATVFVACIVGCIRMVRMPDLPYREVPFISHIRFALNVCLSLLFIVQFLVRRHKERMQRGMLRDPLSWLLLCVAAFMTYFLLCIKSYTAFVVLAVVAMSLLLIYWKRFANKRLRNVAALGFLLLVIVALTLSVRFYNDYYRPKPLMQQPLAAVTQQGNAYHHLQDGLIEDGNYVNNYICPTELEQEWTKRSTLRLCDTTPNGYTIQPTLVRYLNALGTTKDSVGMQLLSDEDIRNIEQGIANPVYAAPRPLKQMYYVMFYEYENYRCYRAVKGFTMLQRLELWRNAWRVFSEHPLLGVGTGDVVDACHAQLKRDDSPLADTNIHSHNQYLTFLVTFGIVGFLIIVVAFVWALRRTRFFKLPIAAGYLIIVLISFLTEDTLETLAGAVFAVLFFCLLALYKEVQETDSAG